MDSTEVLRLDESQVLAPLALIAAAATARLPRPAVDIPGQLRGEPADRPV